ncbi:MAG: hypothetical protein RMK74_10350 [Myxococcales bacterium]|nr:hypothetical protein [Myxococcales bacterium]
MSVDPMRREDIEKRTSPVPTLRFGRGKDHHVLTGARHGEQRREHGHVLSSRDGEKRPESGCGRHTSTSLRRLRAIVLRVVVV